jgi:hypothetical protein
MRPHLVATAFLGVVFVWSAACGGTSSTTSDASDSGTPGPDSSSPPVDAGAADTDIDAGTVAVDAFVPCSDCVTGTLSWGDTGGLVTFRDESSLATCRDFQRKRTLSSDGGVSSCTTQVGGCDAPAVAIGDVERALAHPDVVSAFAAAATPVYGVDSRPVDGTVFEITRNGKSIDVGSPCGSSSAPACVQIPAGVDALAAVLRSLDTQELAKAACSAFH